MQMLLPCQRDVMFVPAAVPQPSTSALPSANMPCQINSSWAYEY